MYSLSTTRYLAILTKKRLAAVQSQTGYNIRVSGNLLLKQTPNPGVNKVLLQGR